MDRFRETEEEGGMGGNGKGGKWRKRGRNGTEWEGRKMEEEGGMGGNGKGGKWRKREEWEGMGREGNGGRGRNGRKDRGLTEGNAGELHSIPTLSSCPHSKGVGKGKGRRQMGISLTHQPPMLLYIIMQLQHTNMKVWAGA